MSKRRMPSGVSASLTALVTAGSAPTVAGLADAPFR